jgi:hypothetical protein
MNTLQTKRESAEPSDKDAPPTWRELAQRLRDLMNDIVREGKELERDLEPKLLPALKRMKLRIEKWIAKLEERAAKHRS